MIRNIHRKGWIPAGILVPVLALGLTVESRALDVSLTVRETAGADREGEFVTSGVPIPMGQLVSDQNAAIAGVDGQFETLATWGDGSVKWLLCTFPATIPAYGSATFHLGNGSGNAPSGPLSVTQTASGVTVTTGPLRFTMKTSGFNLFDEVWIDSNDDGSFSAPERIVSPRSTNGSVVQEVDGDRFSSVESPGVEFVVEESGPLRAVIAFEGVHAGPAGNHLNFSGRVHAYRGRSDVRVQFSQTNLIPTDTYSSGSQPLCRWFQGRGPVGGTNNSLIMDDLSLVTRVDLAGAPTFAIQGSPSSAVQTGALSSDAALYQDSSGGPYWFVSAGTTFSGYQIRNGGTSIASGSRANGFADVSDGTRGLAVATRYFWQEFPNKVAVSSDGTVTVGLMPRDFSDPFEHRPGERKTHMSMFYFHDGSAVSGNVEDVAQGFHHPLRAMASAQYYSDTKAIDDLAPYNPAAFSDYEANNAVAPEGYVERREDSDYYGWMDFGDLWSDFEGGGLPPNTNNAANNMEYDSGFAFIQQALRTSGLNDELSDSWWDLAAAGNPHTADIDVYHVFAGPLHWLWGGMWNHTAHGASGYDDAHRGMSPNAAHTWNRGMLVWYYLTGDRATLDGALKVGENMTWRVENGPGMPGIPETTGAERGPGHTLQILTDMYLHTWNPRYLNAARRVVTESHADTKAYVSNPTSGTWRCRPWMIAILMRNLGRFATVMQAEKGITEAPAIDSLLKFANFGNIKGFVDRTETEPGFIWYEVGGDGWTIPDIGDNNVNMWTTRNSDAYTYAYRFENDPTKKARWRDIAQVSFEDGGAYPWCHTCPRFEYMQAKVQQVHAGSGQEWMRESGGGTSSDAEPPAAITNLAAATGDAEGEIDLTWTAPGDDGNTGRAISYLVRRSPTVINSEGAWQAATAVPGAPVPTIAGTTQTMTVGGLTANQTYFFAIRAKDEAANVGGISNSPSAVAGHETVLPIITSSSASVVNSTMDVMVFWTTNEPTTGRVEYGLSTSYGASTPLDSALKRVHLFTISGFTQGQTLHYRLRSADQYGNERVSSDFAIVLQDDRTAPVVTMRRPDFGTGTATLTFDSSEISYGTFQWGASNVAENSVTLGSATNPTLVHVAIMTGLVPQTTYLTRIMLVDMSGNILDQRSTLFYPGDVADATPPATPLGLKIAGYAEQDGVRLRWDPNSESDLAGYNILRRPVSAQGDSLGPWITLNTSLIETAEYEDPSLDPFTYWQYAVTAEDQSTNESGASNPLLYDPERWAGFDLVAVNFPNPFRPGSGTQISFRVPVAQDRDADAPTRVKLTVYDIQGRRVKLLYSGSPPAGRVRTVRFDGFDQQGNSLAGGVYFYRLETPTETLEKKMIVLR